MINEILYEDNLIRIVDDLIILKHYYFPFISKEISFANIEVIESKERTIMEPLLVLPPLAWRLFGCGIIEKHLIWFPFDLLRGTRDKIFIIKYKNQKIRSGFTVENSESVEEILKEKEWLQNIFSQKG